MSGATPPSTAPPAPVPVTTASTPPQQPVAPATPPPQPQPPKTEYQKGREKFHSEYFDPCQEAASRSLRCLARNQGDKDMCADYFQAYRDCKKRWTEERKEEKRKMSAWW